MKFAVVGAGAIGGWLAARLALAGEDVSVIARGATLARIDRCGIQLHSDGRNALARVRVASSAQALGAQDVVLLAVKAPALPGLAPTLAPLLRTDTLILHAGNGLPWWYFLPPGQPCSGLRLRGVDPQGTVEAALPLPQVLGLSVFAACHCPEPGVVQHDSGGRLVLGEPAGGESARTQQLALRLQRAGLDALPSSDIRREIWLKLLGNACFNPVSLLTGATTDEMIDQPQLHALFVQLMEEVIAIGGRLGLRLQVDPARRIAQARSLGPIRTSMLQDLQTGRAVELDAIVGTVLECAAAVAMPAPTLAGILAMARLRARHAGLPAL
ncbi:2-dehydropantoate 2-reductase [Ramlibacter sp. AW1]|uniref:2-dehydropantoate 2-reductase n=1 Tax=Ramlibacter aurantiacus TaxID=2801330 RepID=A0A936ZHG1_9BURK|nr:2-dehydropantoate 2-reductase [Ramlibacter aurantiacus]MBL0419927.1 2-dehydropantoate 2-reductase [Ramlibacter aurantiacus]